MTTESRPVVSGRAAVGHADIVFITLDTLRYDVAVDAMNRGLTPNLKCLIPGGCWEERHTPGNFTYAAHHAFFAGFLPTPSHPGQHHRLFAAHFEGSETTAADTFVFNTPDIVTGLAGVGYHTICIGGVGFFNLQTPLSRVLPGLFHESYWSSELGVTSPDSTKNQVDTACCAVSGQSQDQKIFLFLNVSALHQPNCMYVPGAEVDSPGTQAAALSYVDAQLKALFDRLRQRNDVLCVICSDHGTAYGDDGYVGHRLCHPVVWTVPYAEMILKKTNAEN